MGNMGNGAGNMGCFIERICSVKNSLVINTGNGGMG